MRPPATFHPLGWEVVNVKTHPTPMTFKSLYRAYQRCLKGKRTTYNAIAFQMQALDKLYGQWQSVQAQQYQPAQAVSFITERPKAREIIASDFGDRVIHHWLVHELTPLFEPMFIFDAYANRIGKGTHKAVKRLQGFMHASVRSGVQPSAPSDVRSGHCARSANAGYFLQLDIKNFFNSIDHTVLLEQLAKRLAKCVRKGQINRPLARQCYALSRTIIQHPVAEHAHYKNTPAQRAKVPEHKQLRYAPAGKGLPIGNLTSQFFANVYLNALDQFVKHTLKCTHYVRYVDDFVLLHPSADQLLTWREQIARFLERNLHLQLKALASPTPNHTGADFLGFIVRPHYRLVRHRVSHHCLEKLQHFASQHICTVPEHEHSRVFELNASYEQLARLRSVLASYWGHFGHASGLSTISWVLARHAWLRVLFLFEGNRLYPRYENRTLKRFYSQCQYFRHAYPQASVAVRCGYAYQLWPALTPHPANEMADKMANQSSLNSTQGNTQAHADGAVCVTQVRVEQQGFLKHGLRHRVAVQYVFSASHGLAFVPNAPPVQQ